MATKKELKERALEFCYQALRDRGYFDMVSQAKEIINAPQIKVKDTFYIVVTESDCAVDATYRDADMSRPIVGETYLDNPLPYEKAVEHAKMISDKYGKVFIARLTIIEEYEGEIPF